jgi:hypothetical protein
MLKRLKELNPDIAFYDVYSEEFSEYGRVISDIDTNAIVKEAEKIETVKEGSVYLPSVAEFEALDIYGEVCEKIFGKLDTQLGYCYGHSSMLAATEWHSCSELNVAITPLVLILGKRSDIEEGRLDSAKMKAFLVPAGTVLEVYATTLHFCPCEVSESGFGCVVGLLRGTNTPLNEPVSDKLLFRNNKWIIAHDENEALISKGVIPGIYGTNYKINY